MLLYGWSNDKPIVSVAVFICPRVGRLTYISVRLLVLIMLRTWKLKVA